MGYSISNIQSNQGVQTIFESSGEHASGNFKSPKGDQLTSNVVQTLNLKGAVINVTTDNDVVSVIIINKHDHTSLCCQPVIQNDIWAHPAALNKIVARAVAGDENNIQYYHKNYLDHVYAVSDSDGDIKEHYRYTAFGEAEIYNTQGQKLAESAIDNDVLWNSRRFDGDTGLYYYKYRHYAPELGRWLGRDPIEEDGGVNLYAFVGNDPIGKWDKLGLHCCLCPHVVPEPKKKCDKNSLGAKKTESKSGPGCVSSDPRHLKNCLILSCRNTIEWECKKYKISVPGLGDIAQIEVIGWRPIKVITGKCSYWSFA